MNQTAVTLSTEKRPSTGFTPVEIEAIDIFVRIAQFIGLPKSVGEIYGVLFVSADPLSLDDICERLNMSKGSASQGLKLLRSIQAIKASYIPGDRRDLYVLDGNLQNLVDGFLKDRVEPGVQDLGQRIERLKGLTGSLSNGERKRYAERVEKLRKWQRQVEQFIPAIARLLLVKK